MKIYLYQYYNEIKAYYCAKDVDLNSEAVRKRFEDLYDDGPQANIEEKSSIIKVDEEQLIADLTLLIGRYYLVDRHLQMGRIYPMISFRSFPSNAEKKETFQSRYALLPALLRSLDMEVCIDQDLKNYLVQKQYDSASNTNISMMVLGGFIAIVGLTAVAIALTFLSVTTGGVAGLAVACGVTASLSGAGLFAMSTYSNKHTTNESFDISSHP